MATAIGCCSNELSSTLAHMSQGFSDGSVSGITPSQGNDMSVYMVVASIMHHACYHPRQHFWHDAGYCTWDAASLSMGYGLSF